ncbi:Short-chain dehydrogenase [Rhizobiales bacterium GAS113]|nr:Short-chain dehydrogenase [Rhizobiales bacterium GAS113]
MLDEEHEAGSRSAPSEAILCLHGRTALVTGGTDGIGKEIARGLARRGCRLIIVGRDAEKGARAEQKLRLSTENSDVDYLQADLGLMRHVKRLADEVGARWPSLHYLVHDAGVVLGRRELTAEGIESNFAINYLSRFALTRHLLPLLLAGGRPERAARIVIVSGAAQGGKVHFEDVNLTSNFATLRAVMQSCRANDLFTAELAQRLPSQSPDPQVTVTCLKIGVVKTQIRRGFPLWMRVLVPLLFDPLLGQTPQDAAEAAMRLLLAKDLEGVTGALFMKIRKLKRIAPDNDPRDREDGRLLWQLSEKLAARGLAFADMPARRSMAAGVAG